VKELQFFKSNLPFDYVRCFFFNDMQGKASIWIAFSLNRTCMNYLIDGLINGFSVVVRKDAFLDILSFLISV